ncbi:MAG: response regulator, partial [Pedobacter sp.]
MEKITCVVVDDNPRDLAHLVALIETNSSLQLKGSFNNPVEAATFILAHQPELLFLDIEMPGFTGLEFLKSLPYSPECIFVTAFEEHSVESWEVFAFDFIVKPLRPDRFNKCVLHLQDYFNTKGKANLYDEIYKQDG